MDPNLAILATIIMIIITLIIIKPLITSKSNLPPGKFGWPFYGETIEYVTHPEKFMQSRMKKFSPEIFKTSILGEKVAILCGPSANKFIFSNEGKLFDFWMPPSLASSLSAPNLDKNSVSSRFSMEQLHKFLKLENLQQLVPLMDSKSGEYFDFFWAPYEIVRVHPLTKDFTFMVTCFLFLNYGKQEKVEELAKPFFDLHVGTMSKSVSLPFYSVKKKQRRVHRKIMSVIKERKVEIINGKKYGFVDYLSRALMAAEENGIRLNEEEVAAKINTLLFASFYTINTAITFVVYYLADHPDVYDKVLQGLRLALIGGMLFLKAQGTRFILCIN